MNSNDFFSYSPFSSDVRFHSNKKSNVEFVETAKVGVKVPECYAAVLTAETQLQYSYSRDSAWLVSDLWDDELNGINADIYRINY